MDNRWALSTRSRRWTRSPTNLRSGKGVASGRAHPPLNRMSLWPQDATTCAAAARRNVVPCVVLHPSTNSWANALSTLGAAPIQPREGADRNPGAVLARLPREVDQRLPVVQGRAGTPVVQLARIGPGLRAKAASWKLSGANWKCLQYRLKTILRSICRRQPCVRAVMLPPPPIEAPCPCSSNPRLYRLTHSLRHTTRQAWYEFAQKCFLEGHGDLARRALRALQGNPYINTKRHTSV